MAYVAFISYKHSSQSRPQAEALEAALKRYAKPLWKPPVPLFRDERVLRPGDDLPTEIRRALEQSEYLIYLASKEAAESPWVNLELETWCKTLERGARLLIVHIADRINVDPIKQEVIWAETDALPTILKPYIASIPVWADLSWAETSAHRDLNNLQYKKVVNGLTAVFRNKKPCEMNDEEVLTHRKNILFRNVGIFAIVAFATAATFFGFQARRDRIAAEQSAQRAQASASQARQSASEATASKEVAVLRQRDAEDAGAREREQRHIAEENRVVAELNATRTELRGRAAHALAALAGEPPVALRQAAAAVRDSARQFGQVPTDLQFSLTSALLSAREAFRAPIRIMPSAMAVPPDGSQLVVASLDLVTLYTPTGVLRRRPLAAENAGALNANAVAFSLDGKLVATGGGLRQENHHVRIWSSEGRLLAGPLTGHHAVVRAVAFSPDSTTIVSGAEDGSLTLWRTDGTPLWSKPAAYQGSINALAFAPDGLEIVGGGGNPPLPAMPGARQSENGIRTWSAMDGSHRAVRRTDATVHSIDASADGIVSGGADGIVRIWERFDLQPKAVGRGHSGAIRTLKIDPVARVIATGGDDGRIGLWNMLGDPIAPLQSGHTGSVRGVGFLPGKNVVVSVAEDATLRWWNLSSPAVGNTPGPGTVDAAALQVRSGGGVIATDNRFSRISETGAHPLSARLDARPEATVQSIAYSATDFVAVVLGDTEWHARVLLGKADTRLREILRTGLMPSSKLLFSPDGQQLFVGGGLPGTEVLSPSELGTVAKSIDISNAFWLYATDGRLVAGPIRLGAAVPLAAAYSPDSRLLVVGDSAGRVHFFDRLARVVRKPIETDLADSSPLARAVTALAVSSDGRTLAVATGAAVMAQSAGGLALWDLGTGTLVATLPGHGERVNALAFSTDGHMLASGGGQDEFVPGRRDYSIRLWASPSGHALSPPWVGHEERVVDLMFTSRNTQLVSLDGSGTRRQWTTGWRAWTSAAEDRSALLRDASIAEKLRVQGDRLSAAGNHVQALAKYTAAIGVRRTDPDLHWLQAQTLVRLNRLPEALAAQTEAINHAPYDGVRLFERGKLRDRLKDLNRAIADFTAALDVAAFIIRPAPVIAEGLPWSRQVSDQASAASKIAVADIRRHRAWARLRLGDMAGAAEDLDEAFALGLRSSDFFFTRAVLRRQQGDQLGAGEDEAQARRIINKTP